MLLWLTLEKLVRQHAVAAPLEALHSCCALDQQLPAAEEVGGCCMAVVCLQVPAEECSFFCRVCRGATLSLWSCCSQMSSSCGRKLLARWQFCSTTQNPPCMPCSMQRCATGPCPCPRDTTSTRVERSSAKFKRAAVGSLQGRRHRASSSDVQPPAQWGGTLSMVRALTERQLLP